MNLVLVDAHEVREGVIVLDDRRGEHLRDVLGAAIGERVKVGVIAAGAGTAEVVAIDGARFTLRLDRPDLPTLPAPAPMPVELVLAVPRPKALSRVVEAAASFAVERVDLTNAWRVDKSYLASPRLAPDALALAARLGAEQGATTHLPAIRVHPRLMPLLDARWPGPSDDGRTRLIAHPGGVPLEDAYRGGPATLAIGPEGGWIAREVETFVARGFTAISLGTPILRVETAVAAALGQLALLQRLRV